MSGYLADDSAVVGQGVQIGDGSRIWHFVHVSAGARIGRNVTLDQNVFVGGGAVIGDDCKIENNVSIYDRVILEDGVFCGPSVVFTNVSNPRARVVRKDEYRDTCVRTGATLGANCTVVCGVIIGRYSFVAAGAVVTRDVKDHALVAGVPAQQIGWMSEHGERLDLALEGEGQAQCPGTGEAYALKGGECRRVDR